MESSTDNEFLKEECSYLQFEINDLQRIVERADTKTSILLTAIGVFLSVAATVMNNPTSVKWLFWVSLISSAATILFGVCVLWNRKVQGLAEKSHSFNIQEQIRNRLQSDVKDLRDVCKVKYLFFKLSLITFTLATIATIVLVITTL